MDFFTELNGRGMHKRLSQLSTKHTGVRLCGQRQELVWLVRVLALQNGVFKPRALANTIRPITSEVIHPSQTEMNRHKIRGFTPRQTKHAKGASVGNSLCALHDFKRSRRNPQHASLRIFDGTWNTKIIRSLEDSVCKMHEAITIKNCFMVFLS